MSDLANLKILDLWNNPIPIPPELLSQTDKPDVIVNYYLKHYRMEERKRPLNEAKILLVGEGGVGKTSLVKRLVEGSFDSEEDKTEGIDIKTWGVTIDNKKIKLRIWDFGGQEILHSTHQVFLTKRSIYLLVLDSRYNEVQNRLHYWLKIIRNFGADSPIIVVGNKCDVNTFDTDWEALSRAYSPITYLPTVSCKTGAGIKLLKATLEKEINNLEGINDQVLITWLRVKEKLEQLENDYISYTKYQEICKERNVVDPLDQKTLITLLHELGIVLHFHNSYTLENTTVLNPEWVTRAIYQILSDRELFVNKMGILDRESLNRILNVFAYSPDEQMFIINMMMMFELCFALKEENDELFLMPDLLPRTEPYTGEWLDGLNFQYHYEIMPSSIITRFIVRMHKYILQNTYWRNGVVLEYKENRALVKADIEEEKIFICVSGRETERRIFLGIIRAELDRIHSTIPGIGVKERVPLPNHPEVVVDYQHLLSLEEMGEETFIPQGLPVPERVSIRKLLEGIEFKQQSIPSQFLLKFQELTEDGQNEVVEAFKELITAIEESREINDYTRTEALKQLEDLSEQATLPPQKRKRRLVTPILSGLSNTLSASGNLASTWSVWGEKLSRFFEHMPF